MSERVLITGGNGFIGTQIADQLYRNGYDVVAIDRKLKNKDVPYRLIEGDYLDYLKSDTNFKTIVHLAADHQVELSVTRPSTYYDNNVVDMKDMLDTMVNSGIKNIVFSSSGSIYGRQSGGKPLSEDLYYDPQNPYASTKVAGELMIKEYARAYDLKYVIFRYFNAAGADSQNRYGYVQQPASHVMPILCNKILNREVFKVYGTDYETKDGTCVRDYVNVNDLATAHAMALDFINDTPANEIFNVGGGNSGVSVLELINHAEKVTGKPAIIEYASRREGDTPCLIANIDKIKNMLGWRPRYDIQQTIRQAYNWEQKLKGNN